MHQSDGIGPFGRRPCDRGRGLVRMNPTTWPSGMALARTLRWAATFGGGGLIEPSRSRSNEEHGMGDKGGKKDKDKLEKQKAKKKGDKAKEAEKKRPKSSKPTN